MDEWVTLPQLARELGVSDSTARRWAATFPELLPSKGKGASRRFHPQARQVLAKLQLLLEGGITTEQAAAVLHREYSATLDVVPVSSPQAGGDQRAPAPADLLELVTRAIDTVQQETAAVLAEQERRYIGALQEQESRYLDAIQRVQASAEHQAEDLRSWLTERLPEPQAKRLGLVARVKAILTGDKR